MSHTCHANLCKTETPEKYLMCFKHWSLVPKDIQNEVWKAYKNTTVAERVNSVEYMLACAKAVEHMATLEGKNIYNSYRNIANRLLEKQGKNNESK